jgi:hypothetical protein
MVEPSKFTDFILPRADHMATTVTDSLNYNFNTAKGKTGLHDPYSSLTAVGIDASCCLAEAAITTDRPDGVGSIAMGYKADTFTDTRKAQRNALTTSPLR